MSTLSLTFGAAGDHGKLPKEPFMDSDSIRTAFTLAMSAMYKDEVPLYGDLIRIVRAVNKEVLDRRASTESQLEAKIESPNRLDIERHGAIRLGTPYELRTMRRLFKVIGLQAVGYYDLSVANLPMHATCFRPIEKSALEKNPFRVFTTLLRPELLHGDEARDFAMTLLARREIFTPELLRLIDTAEHQGCRLTDSQAESFIVEAMKTFGWRPVASATESEYKKLASEHPILADIASFKSSHINHLTPRTLDISASHKRMELEGLKVKDRIEGPPARKCPILLRQTSFLALEEGIKFVDENGVLIEGTHKARFGEIEERGAAVTLKGRKLYDDLLEEAKERYSALRGTSGNVDMDTVLDDVFSAYPDEWSKLRDQGLIYCTYQLTSKPRPEKLLDDTTLHALVSDGYLKADPITYEDFLPFSAAGIFQSNIGSSSKSGHGVRQSNNKEPDQDGFEEALGCKVLSTDALYLEMQEQSLEECAKESGWKFQFGRCLGCAHS